MKASATLSLCIAPLALAKAVHNVYPGSARRSQNLDARRENSRVSLNAGVGANSVSGLSAAELQLLGLSGVGISENALTDVVVIWVNGGGGAATTVINEPVTTTVTVQANGGAVATEAVNAGSTTVAAGATSVVSGVGATHTVTVGGEAAGLAYTPSSISAAIGDMVIFTFLSQNHTATQSAFTTPCEALAGGMDSGFQPNINNSVNPPPQVAMQVMVDTPLWFYCKQKGHCGKGMTFSINPTATKTQALFQSMAIAQNGTGTGSAITGNGGSSSAAAADSSTSSTSIAAAAAGAAATESALASVPSGFAVGQGTMDSNGACVCAAVCTSGAFPAVAQGAGAFGGNSGELYTPLTNPSSLLPRPRMLTFSLASKQAPYPPA